MNPNTEHVSSLSSTTLFNIDNN